MSVLNLDLEVNCFASDYAVCQQYLGPSAQIVSVIGELMIDRF